MPKVRRARSLSLVRSSSSPYAVSSKDTESCNNADLLKSAQGVKEWEDSRCPICMEHPHNAVLLKCSSHEKGCRPYMCNTSYRHSNCFEQFCKLYGPIPLTTQLQEIPFTSGASDRQMEECSPSVQNGDCGNPLQSELICPLCRGSIYGYVVMESARQYMNSKVRSCSSETCDFSGTYSELRKHARSEHPYVRPSEVDPVRRHDWVRLQRERDIEDVLSLVQSDYVVDGDEDLTFTRAVTFWMSSFVTEMYDSLMDLLSDNVLGALRDIESLQERMENARRDMDSNFSTRMINNFSSDTRQRSYEYDTRWPNFRSSQQLPRTIQFHRHNQRQRPLESTSRSQQLRWRSHSSFDRRRSFESTSHTSQPRRQHGSLSNSIPHAPRLLWRNQPWSTSTSSYHNER